MPGLGLVRLFIVLCGLLDLSLLKNPAVVSGNAAICRQQRVIPGGAGGGGAEQSVPGEQGAIPQTVQEPEGVDDRQPSIDGMQGGAAAEGERGLRRSRSNRVYRGTPKSISVV